MLALVSVWGVFAQKGSVTATVWDADAQSGVPGAVIEVALKQSPDKKSYFTSGYGGSFTMSLAYGEYQGKVTFLGYEETPLEFRVNGAKRDLGRIELHQSAQQIETVVKEVQALRTSQKGDTLSYNAAAFKVAADADVEGLLKKMTGITVSNGTVEVQGEEVKKIFVDGKEFFGEDVTTAIKSLPAEAVDRVEVFNKLSDQAEFSGMDDGEGYKALNIVTHSNMRQGQFGKIYAGGGYDFEEEKGKYLAGGNVNIFNGDSRLSVLALFNNVNQQNFSFEDILGVSGGGGMGRGVGQYMVRPQAGVATVNAVGLNYSDTWGSRDQVTFQGSYFFNHTRTKNNSTRDRWSEYNADEAALDAILQRDTLTETGTSLTTNQNHRFNARLEWKISENQSLMSRTSFSYQQNDPESLTTGEQWGNSGYSKLYDQSKSDYSGYSLGEFLQYRAKLGKTGRTITLDGYVRYQDNESGALTIANEASAAEWQGAYNPALFPEVVKFYQDANKPTMSYRLRGNFTYTEPVAKYAQVSLQYRFGYEYDEADKQTNTGYDLTNLLFNPTLSNTYNSTYTTHQVGPGFRWAYKKNTLVANVYYQRSTLDGEFVYPSPEKITRNYNHFTYFLMGNFQFNPQNSIRLFVRSSTDEPNIGDLQSVYNLPNPQYISTGNPELDPSYSHNIRFHYVNSNIEKGRTFMWMFTLQNISDYVATNVEYGKEIEVDGTTYKPLQFSSPVNMDGYWSLRTHLSYGLPLNFIKCNLNLMAGVNYSLVPSMINGERNDASNMGYDANLTLGSNISENVDFTLSWFGTYNEAKNSLLTSAAKNRYFNHSASASLKWTFWKGFTLTASANYNQYVGFTNDYNEEYLLCNVYLGKKFLKNQRAEIQIGVNDLLNQNKAFARTTGSGWVQNATNSVVGRYYMVNLIFNLRHFGKKGSTNIADYEGMGGNGGSGMRPMGPPPGGFR